MTAANTPFYAIDEFQITPELRFDAGLRYQNYKATGSIENNSSVDTDNNPIRSTTTAPRF